MRGCGLSHKYFSFVIDNVKSSSTVFALVYLQGSRFPAKLLLPLKSDRLFISNDQVHLEAAIKALESQGHHPQCESRYATKTITAALSRIPLTQKFHPSQLRSATQGFLCPLVICISNTHINLYLCTQCLHERLHIVLFTLDLCPKENMEDSRGWGNYENLFILYISDSQMNGSVTIERLMNIALPPAYFYDQLLAGCSDLTLTLKSYDRSSGSSPSLVFGCSVCSVCYYSSRAF